MFSLCACNNKEKVADSYSDIKFTTLGRPMVSLPTFNLVFPPSKMVFPPSRWSSKLVLQVFPHECTGLDGLPGSCVSVPLAFPMQDMVLTVFPVQDHTSPKRMVWPSQRLDQEGPGQTQDTWSRPWSKHLLRTVNPTG